MKLFLLGMMSFFSLTAFAQLFNDVNQVVDQFKYDKGIKIKPKKIEIDDGTLWFNQKPVGNTQVITREDTQNPLNDKVRVEITYENIKNRKRINSVREIVTNDKNKIESVFSTELRKNKLQQASKCTLIDKGDEKGRYNCVTVDIPFCKALKKSIEGNIFGSAYLEKCAQSLNQLNQVISDSDHLTRLQEESQAHKSTTEKLDPGSIAYQNGNIIGTDVAKQAGIGLQSIIEMKNLCDNNSLHNRKNRIKYKKPKKNEKKVKKEEDKKEEALKES